MGHGPGRRRKGKSNSTIRSDAMDDAASVASIGIRDPRAASAIIRGYEYQIYRSVVEWLKLGPDEELYLERGEDLERRSPKGIRHDQVRDRQSDVSLGRADVLTSLKHFWRRRFALPRPTFRFITTGAVCIERRQPFGPTTAGIELWRNAAMLPTDEAAADVLRLRDYLIGREKLDLGIRAFLQAASAEEIHREIITRFDWITSEPQADSMESEAKELLAAFGSKYFRLPRNYAEQLFSRLVKEALEVAARDPQRPLTRADLFAIFEHQYVRTITVADFEAELQKAVEGLLPQAEARTFLFKYVITDPPPVPSRYTRRKVLYDSVREAFKHNTSIILSGAAGVGKSALAKDITSTLAGSWKWVNLREVPQGDIAGFIVQVERELLAVSELRFLVIDDLDIASVRGRVRDALSRLAAVLAQRNGRLIITTSSEIAADILPGLNLSGMETIRVPPYDGAEVLWLLRLYTDDPAALGTATEALLLTTSGNPTLVDAWLAHFEATGFDLTALLHAEKPPAVLSVERQTRNAISLLAKDARDMLYRVSVAVVPLERERVLELGLFEPAIGEPGIALDAIIGSWLEVVNEAGALRRSPLIADLATNALGIERALQFEYNVVDVLIRREKLLSTDLAGILYHGIRGSHEHGVVIVLAALLQTDEETIRSAAHAAPFFVRPQLGDNVQSFSAAGRLVIRVAQFRMATLLGQFDDARAIVGAFDAEFPATEVHAVARFRFLGYITVFGNQPIADRLHHALRWVREAESSRAVAAIVERAPKRRLGDMGSAGMASSMVLVRVRSFSDLDAFVEALRQADRTEGRRFLAWLADEDFALRGLFGALRVTEFDRDEPQWERLIEALLNFAALLACLDLPNVAVHVHSEISRIRSEQLKDPAAGLRDIELAISGLGRQPGLESARALALFLLGDNERAYSIWSAVLPALRATDRDVQPSMDAREAAIAAGKLGRFGDAERWLTWASERLSDQHFQPMRVAYRFDAAFAAWKDRRDDDALAHLVTVLPRMQALERTGDRFAFATFKRIGHVLAWMGRPDQLRHRAYHEPTIGDASHVDDEIPRDRVRPTRFVDIVEAACEFEFQAGTSSLLFDTYRDELKPREPIDAPIGGDRVGLGWRLRRFELQDLAEHVVSIADAMTQFSRESGQVLTPGLLYGLVDAIALVALLAALSENASDELILQWSLTYRRAGYNSTARRLERAIELRDNTGRRSRAVLEGIQKPQNAQEHESRILAAIVYGTNPHVVPSLLVVCVHYWIDAVQNATPMLGVAEALTRIVDVALTRTVNDGTQFTNPRKNLPILKEALASRERPWQKFRTIALTLAVATGRNTPREIEETLTKLADEERKSLESR
jgi:hypothetical protein